MKQNFLILVNNNYAQEQVVSIRHSLEQLGMDVQHCLTKSGVIIGDVEPELVLGIKKIPGVIILLRDD